MTVAAPAKGAGDLEGVPELYEAYAAAHAPYVEAKQAGNLTPELSTAFHTAAAALSEARSYWRQIHRWLRAVADANFEAQQAAAVEVTEAEEG